MRTSPRYWLPLITGVRRLLLGRRETFTRAEPSARYIYALWMRTLVELDRLAGTGCPSSVLELGPGQSLGVCAAALLTGATRYVGLDIHPYAIPDRDVALAQSLADMLAQRAPIPDREEFPRLYPQLQDNRFPNHLLDDAYLQTCLAPNRRVDIETALRSRSAAGDIAVRYCVPWGSGDLPREGVDLVLSQAVLQCIPQDQLTQLHAQLFRTLRPGGIALHQIDLGFPLGTPCWNFHRAYSDTEWYVVNHDREYAVTRLVLSDHLAAAEAAGFEILEAQVRPGSSSLDRSQVSKKFQSLSAKDFDASGVFLVLRR